ncbi:MAG: glutamine--tRNA ligase/YqeY domain fusion protein [Crocinitomicaceae bacterium]|jgi:glutaminyl-tRNA synthetase|nr:glutamine--tRNA ligase/YqeY domain fusion protein [Crocinitomicaceae bacterium]
MSNKPEAADDSMDRPLNFIEQKIEADIAAGKHGGRVHTRFPPEPNGHLHIGHAKAICVSFGLAKKYGGVTNLRFDDTNPEKESTEYVNAIREDVSWLGFEWEGGEYYTSDYFDQLYSFACQLIKSGKAYVDDQTAEDMADQKGAPGKPGVNSPFRDRSPEENLELFEGMKAGKFPEASHVLRAKIDMAHENMLMRDPLIYRIKFVEHHRTGNDWVIYPMYDFAHGQSDSIENITHSLCSLEFENHRPLYNWFIENLGIYPTEQTEFARLNLSYTLMSKRKLLKLVEDGVVDGWDDPRLPTISGLRRRGYTPQSIRTFADRIGVAKRNNEIDVSLLEWALRDDANRTAPRVMGVLNPIKLVVLNYPEGEMELLTTQNNPEDAEAGTRELPFGRELWMEADDFKVDVNKKWFRLAPGRVVRLKSAYIVEYANHLEDDAGNVTEVHVNYFENSKSGQDVSGIKAKGTLHWVSCAEAVNAEVRLYDRLFSESAPEANGDFMDCVNENSLEIKSNCKLEPSLANAEVGTVYQFTRLGYFTVDKRYSTANNLVFNRAVTLKDSWKG